MLGSTAMKGSALAAALIAVSIGSATAASQVTAGAANHQQIDLAATVQPKVNNNHVVYVTNLGSTVNPYLGDEAGITMTGEGAQLGPFPDGGGCTTPGTDFARLVFHPLDGKTLASIHQLDYSGMTQSTDNTSGVGSLSMRIVTGAGNKFVFTPNTQPGADQNADTRGVLKTYLTTFGYWRVNDDAGAGPDSPWSSIIADHQSETITKIDVLLGCEAGANLRGVVRTFQANGTEYVLGRIG